ncbi:ROK family protein [Streptomyces goshikiensis]|uniref:ROK family protein n=1 Tax=Streptomyces goshikiensis TaxID=1942 RepID=UPI00371EA1BC
MSSFHHDEVPGPSLADAAREAEVRRLIQLLDEAPGESLFQALGMLISDASLAADESALEAAQDGLQWLHARSSAVQKDLEQRGRLLGLIDVTHWALQRLPSGLQLSLDPDGHSARFLLTVAREPGLSNQVIAVRLGVDETEVSRLGRRLLAAGVVWRRKEWRQNYWDVTPRGQRYLENSGLLAAISETGSSFAFALGVDVRPNCFTGVAIDPEGRIVARHSKPLECALDGVVSQVADFVKELRNSTAEPAIHENSGRLCLGIEIGGHVAQDGGSIICAPNYGSSKTGPVPVSEPVAAIAKMSTVLENDANALAEFERAFGSCTDINSFAVVLIDEGIGCGLVIDGQVMHGARGGAGEIGHVVVEPEGRYCTCGNMGCLESVAGIKAIPEIVQEISGQEVPNLVAAESLLQSSDPKPAETAFQRAGNALGRGISALVNFMDPETVVLYGPSELVDEDNSAARIFMTAVRESSKRYTFSSISSEHALITKTYTAEVGARAVASTAICRLGAS